MQFQNQGASSCWERGRSSSALSAKRELSFEQILRLSARSRTPKRSTLLQRFLESFELGIAVLEELRDLASTRWRDYGAMASLT
jgi:hypothetical protein